MKLERPAYKLVFIGEKGIGKTTTILELFRLTKTVNGESKELLATGSGGTTTCEVELLKSNKPVTWFEIEPVAERQFLQYVDAFCARFDNADDADASQPEKDAYRPTEITRAIKNMAGLTGLKEKDIKALRGNYKDDREFKAEILRRINRQSHTRTVIECQSDNASFFMDCQKKFEDINLGRIKDVMLPKRVKIHLTKDILDFDALPSVSSIIDTRGIDTVPESFSGMDEKRDQMKRSDILGYIKNEQNNCLFVFVDRLGTAPSPGIAELLKMRITTSNKFRFHLVVNVRGNEVEEVMTDDGKAGTVEKGIDYKREDILDKFKMLKIRFSESNLFFLQRKKKHTRKPRYIIRR